MVAVARTFNFTGTLTTIVVPAGTTSLSVHLWGGAGGGGGADAGGGGGVGAAGHHVSATGIAMTSNIGKTLTISVGGGGAGGSSGGGAAGGTNGKSIAGNRYVETSVPTNGQGSNGDLWFVREA